MATDCQWQRGENWRRNSAKWGSQGWEGGASPSPSPGGANQMPPPIPAPPLDPQDNLARNTPSPVLSYENENSTIFWCEGDDTTHENENGTVEENDSYNTTNDKENDFVYKENENGTEHVQENDSYNTTNDKENDFFYKENENDGENEDKRDDEDEENHDENSENISKENEENHDENSENIFQENEENYDENSKNIFKENEENSNENENFIESEVENLEGNETIENGIVNWRENENVFENEENLNENENFHKEEDENLHGIEEMSINDNKIENDTEERNPIESEDCNYNMYQSPHENEEFPNQNNEENYNENEKISNKNDEHCNENEENSIENDQNCNENEEISLENDQNCNENEEHSNKNDDENSSENYKNEKENDYIDEVNNDENEEENDNNINKKPDETETCWWENEENEENKDKDEDADNEASENVSNSLNEDATTCSPENEKCWWENEENENDNENDESNHLPKMNCENETQEQCWWEVDEEDENEKNNRENEKHILNNSLKIIPEENTKCWWENYDENDEGNDDTNQYNDNEYDNNDDRYGDDEYEYEIDSEYEYEYEDDTSTGAPPPPPPPPMRSKSNRGPPPPPAPPSRPLSAKEKRVKEARENMVESIKKAARSRPDWHSVMQDIAGGINLRKVNSGEKLDRSKPILPKSRGKGGKFFYESEKPVVQNILLGEIHRGVKLRHVRTNDRSKPDFNKLGLRKLRRQLTVEEKKSLDPDAPEGLPSSSDEEDDIDRMRDDLVATKAQLADEMKSKKKLATEHKILKIDLESLKAEVKKMKRQLKEAGVREIKPLANGEANAIGPKLSKSMSKLRMMEEDVDFSELDIIEEDIKLLNGQIEAQRKRAETAERKSDEVDQKLQVSKNSSDEWEMRSVYFEKKYKYLQREQGIELPDINCIGTQSDPVDFGPVKSESSGGLPAKKSSSRKSITSSFSRMQSFKEVNESDDESSSTDEDDTLSDHPGGDEDEEEEESDEGEEEVVKPMVNHADVASRNEERDFIMWTNKLSHAKDKDRNVHRERNNLRDRIKKYYKDTRREREDYLKLKEELKELLDQMKDPEEKAKQDKEDEDYDYTDDEEENSEEDVEDGDEAPEWWCDEAAQKPKKLKKRQNKNKPIIEDDEDEIVDLSGLDEPEWTDSEPDDSGSDDDEDDQAKRLTRLKERTGKFEQSMNLKKKETYTLKTQIDRCDDMYAEEKRRHARLENELHMLLADI